MFDHIGFGVRDFPASGAFYSAALAPLGCRELWQNEEHLVAAFGARAPQLWIHAGDPGAPLHIAFVAPDRAAVEAFHAAGLQAGGRDNGAPGLRDYAPGYFAAYVYDPDGNNVEAVVHEQG